MVSSHMRGDVFTGEVTTGLTSVTSASGSTSCFISIWREKLSDHGPGVSQSCYSAVEKSVNSHTPVVYVATTG